MWSEFLKSNADEKSDETEKKDRMYLVEQMNAPIREILKKISPDIEQGNYGLIIGDDASGRLPTLLLSNIIKAAYHERDYPLPGVRFIAGSRNLDGKRKMEKKKLLSDYLNDELIPGLKEWRPEDLGIRLKDYLTGTKGGGAIAFANRKHQKGSYCN